MGHEQQSRALEVIPKPRVVDRGYDSLACAGCGNEQVAMVPTLARKRDLLEQALLKRFGPKLDRTEKHHRVGRRTSGFGGKPCGVVRHKIAAVPIAFEHGSDFVNDIGISRTGYTDVPFKSADLC